MDQIQFAPLVLTDELRLAFMHEFFCQLPKSSTSAEYWMYKYQPIEDEE